MKIHSYTPIIRNFLGTIWNSVTIRLNLGFMPCIRSFCWSELDFNAFYTSTPSETCSLYPQLEQNILILKSSLWQVAILYSAQNQHQTECIIWNSQITEKFREPPEGRKKNPLAFLLKSAIHLVLSNSNLSAQRCIHLHIFKVLFRPQWE